MFTDNLRNWIKVSSMLAIAFTSLCTPALAEWRLVGTLSKYKGIPNYDVCQYRAEVVYPSIKGEIGSSSVLLSSRYRYRGTGKPEKGSGNMDGLSGIAPPFMSNQISMGKLFSDPALNDKKELMSNYNLNAEIFSVEFRSDGIGSRSANEAHITFVHPTTKQSSYEEVNANSVRLYEDCGSSFK